MNRQMRRGKWPFMAKTMQDVAKAADAASTISDEERLRITRELDVEAAKRMFPMMNEDAILPMLHKVRYETVGVDDELRVQSRAWLEVHGMGRMRGLPWPPEDVLPE